MKEQFIDKNFRHKALNIINIANEIIEEYQEAGYSLTLRQLYYQFVARDHIENTQKSYNNLGTIINDARLAGLVNWSAIEDRTRFLRGTNTYGNPKDFLLSKVEDYHIDRWATQGFRPEVWIEKDALVGVIEPICSELEIDFFACRGYVSQSEIYIHAKRMARTFKRGQIPIVIHLGDHDPSGIDMTRDIGDRLKLLAECTIEVRRVALTIEQVEEKNPPPNPAKITDSRAAEYMKKFGKSSWELDALEPAYISKLIEDEVYSMLDLSAWEKSGRKQNREIKLLRKIANGV